MRRQACVAYLLFHTLDVCGLRGDVMPLWLYVLMLLIDDAPSPTLDALFLLHRIPSH